MSTETFDKKLFTNRELSWLRFNDRVMQEAGDPSVPLIQRLRFLGIFSNNLDEFFKVRVASLRRMIDIKGRKYKQLPGDLSPIELFNAIQEHVILLQHSFEDAYGLILKQMAVHSIFMVNEKQLDLEQQEFVRKYFLDSVSSQIVPLIFHKTVGKLPLLTDDRIYLAAKMKKGTRANYAILEIPSQKNIPRFLVLPSPAGQTHIMFLDDVIRLCLDEIFFMFDFETIEAYTFKFTRDAEMTLDDDISKSTLEKMEDSLELRTLGRPVRFVYDKQMPEDMLTMLLKKLGLKIGDNINAGARYHQMRDLMKFPKIAPELESTMPSPIRHPKIRPFTSVIGIIKQKDVLLNFPYHSFNHLIDFLRESAVDPKVEEIYVTLYRVAERSRVVNALINAAKNGKRVTVLIELLARFDEENNIYWTDVLQRAGIKVINGVDGLKVHSKLVLVRRREGGALVGYTYVGTGNLNEATAGIYTDLGLLTSHKGIAEDAMMVFEFLQKNHKRFDCKHLLVSPYQMRKPFVRLVEQEIRNAQKGKQAYIYLKVNSLVDEEMIAMLYKASEQGVDVRLIVRSACCLKPQVSGLSDNIRAISIVDMYLEHSRFAIFCDSNQNTSYIMSADWMGRNFDRRIEVAAPIYDAKIRKILYDIFTIQWNDNVKARDLSSGEENRYVHNNLPECRSQLALYDYFAQIHEY